MNKIKIIDLLNMISKGEEVPKKIRFNNIEWNKVYGEKNVCYINEYDSDFFLYFFRKNLDFTLNDEVEIIEKNKKIEKLDTSKYFYVGPYTENQPKRYDIDVFNKINEIINYINKEGGNNDMFS